MNNRTRFDGMLAATFTPFDSNGQVNYEVIEIYADKVANSAIRGVFVCGTTGEFMSLSLEERMLILEKWIACAKKRFKVIAHVGSNCQLDAMKLAKHAEEVGAYAIASLAPSFFKPEQVSDLIEFFKPIAESASSLPFYYYNMPSMTGVSLSVPDFLHEGAKRIKNLVGVKFTHNNLMEMSMCLTLDEGRFEVLHGYDEILIAGLSFGATGGVGSTYNYIPQVYDAIFTAMQKGEVDIARKYQEVSIEVVKVICKYGGGVRGGKAIMNLIGIECGTCRSPLSPFSEKEYGLLKCDLEQFALFDLD